MDYRKKLLVKPGSKVSLKNIDPGWHGQHDSEKEATEEIAKHLASIAEHQRLLYGEKRHALLIVLQGIDAAGKDGVCWHVIKGMNPQGVNVTGFKQPTPEALAHDFLWRVHPHTPGLGQVAVFNRSHYEAMLEKCSTKHAPWYILPSNNKWFRNLAASQIIASTLEGLHMKLPKPEVDIEAIKAQYHSAAATPSSPEKPSEKAKKKAKGKKAS